jgi:hypothetical protein
MESHPQISQNGNLHLKTINGTLKFRTQSQRGSIKMHARYECYLFNATKMKIGRCSRSMSSGRSTLSSRRRYSRGGNRRGKM